MTRQVASDKRAYQAALVAAKRAEIAARIVRREAMQALRQQGRTLAWIGRQWGISRQRVAMILEGEE